jgi:hypothetical protein
MESKQEPTGNTAELDRMTLIRDIAVLQVKLVVDGLRDFVLVPVSLVAGIMSLFDRDPTNGDPFYNLLRIGRRSERWINLFGAADRIPPKEDEPDHFPDEDIDALVGRVESFVVDEYRKGRVSRQAKEKLDRLLTNRNRRRRK